MGRRGGRSVDGSVRGWVGMSVSGKVGGSVVGWVGEWVGGLVSGSVSGLAWLGLARLGSWLMALGSARPGSTGLGWAGWSVGRWVGR